MEPLVSAEELAGLLAQPGSLVVIDVGYQLGQPGWGREQYLAGHIPGAHFVDVETELSSHRSDGTGGRHPLPEPEDFQRVMRRCGVDADSTVVVVDQETMLSAGRLWWLLRHHGHGAVRALNGGMRAWTGAGGVVSTVEPEAASGDFKANPGGLPTVDAEQIPALLAAGGRLVDVRAAERFRGDSEPIDPVAGHIPGATNLPASQLMAPDGGFLPVQVLRERLDGLRPGDAVSCGSGLTASQVLLAADAAGIADVALYPGSWSDWITDHSRPVATASRAT